MYRPPKIFASFSNPNRSIAPLIYNFAFRELNINSTYISLEASNIEVIVNSIRGLNMKGASISMPFKESIIPYLDSYDINAQKIGAVNVVTNTNGILKGYNTDSNAAIKSIERITNIAKKKILIVGAGGVARAIIYGLNKYDCEIYLFNRTMSKAENLASLFHVDNCFHVDELYNVCDIDILISTIPSDSWESLGYMLESIPLKAESIIFEAPISQKETHLWKVSKAYNCKYISGFEMYIEHVVEAFYIFTHCRQTSSFFRKATNSIFLDSY